VSGPILARLDGHADAQSIGAKPRFRVGRGSRSRRRASTMLMATCSPPCSTASRPRCGFFNNGAIGFIELETESTGFSDFGTELKNPISRQWQAVVFASFG